MQDVEYPVALQHSSWACNGTYELTGLVLAKCRTKRNFLLQGFKVSVGCGS